ncbi:MAG: efflux RND transporter periplasmic adaptor subunit [Flammeovirgaceae bacterium]
MRVFLIAIVASVALGCAKKQPADIPAETPADAAQVEITEEQFKRLGIELGKPTARVISGVIKANGMLDVPPQNLVSISAPLGGFVKKTELLQGMRVKKGQTIVELEHPDYIQLQEDYLMTKNQLEYLELEYQRQEELAKEKVSAAKDLQMAKSNYQAARAKLMGLKAKLELVKIDVNAVANGELKNSISIPSPISGYVTQVNINLGMYVSPSATMFRIVDTEHLHAEVQVFEKDLPRLKIGQRLFLQLANENAEREGDVYLIGKEITPERTVRVHCHLKREDPQLIPGLFFSARIETEKSDVNTLPEDAVLLVEGKHFVFVEKEPLVFELIEVNKGITENGFTQVTIPVADQGKQIVTKGAYFLLGILKNGGDEE